MLVYFIREPRWLLSFFFRLNFFSSSKEEADGGLTDTRSLPVLASIWVQVIFTVKGFTYRYISCFTLSGRESEDDEETSDSLSSYMLDE